MSSPPPTLRQYAASLPQPVAYGMGRVARASDPSEEFDAILRAAEALTRYAAIVALASFATRDDRTVGIGEDIARTKAFAWGDFLNLARRVASTPGEHRLRPLLAKGFGFKKSQRSGAGPESALDILQSLLEVRNKTTGHSLRARDSASASIILRRERMPEKLLESAALLEPILRLPLIVVETQRRERGQLRARVLPYVGEFEPYPVEVSIRQPVDECEPLIVVGREVLSLSPGLVWEVHGATQQSALFFLDGITSTEVKYRPYSHDDVATRPIEEMQPHQWLRAEMGTLCPFSDTSGNSLDSRLRDTSWTTGTVVEQPAGTPSVPFEAKPIVASPDPLDAQLVAPEVPVETSSTQATRSVSNSRASRAPYQRRSINEIMDQAHTLGLHDHLSKILAATAACGLYNRPYRHGVMSTPQTNKNRYLVWAHFGTSRSPTLHVSLQPDAFEEFFDISAKRVQELLELKSSFAPSDSITALLDGFAQLGKELRPRGGN